MPEGSEGGLSFGAGTGLAGKDHATHAITELSESCFAAALILLASLVRSCPHFTQNHSYLDN
jgi:hypothetical protein